jgi:hypothetical protein
MNELTLLLVINMALAGACIAYWRKSDLERIFLGLGKYIIILLTGWIGFSILVGLFLAFRDLENSKVLSYRLLVGDVIVVLRFMAVGLVLTFLLTWIAVQFSKRPKQKN